MGIGKEKLRLLWTMGGESSMILTLELRSCSRRQRMNALRAALEAEYAGIGVAGTMDRLELVLGGFPFSLVSGLRKWEVNVAY